MGLFDKAKQTVQQIRETEIPKKDGTWTTSTKEARDSYKNSGKK